MKSSSSLEELLVEFQTEYETLDVGICEFFKGRWTRAMQEVMSTDYDTQPDPYFVR
jgi:hypothetical protein